MALLLVLCTLWACGPCDGVPRGVRPGWRLPGDEVKEPVRDWSFTDAADEVLLETSAPWGPHAVTVWCASVGGRLFVATDGRGEKRWVSALASRPKGRIGVDGRIYPVGARPVTDVTLWNAVIEAYAAKYGEAFERYEFPRPDDLGSGHIFELESG